MPFLDDPGPIALAHRGFAGDGGAIENSMSAFARAIALGCRYLETDVRVTADGVALAFHDAALDRVTDRRGRISRLPYSQVRLARIGGREPIPLLVDVLAAWPDARVNLDVKAATSIQPAIDAIRATRSVDRVCVAAFSDARIAAVRNALGPQLCTALGPRDALRLRVTANVPWRNGRRPPGSCAQVPAFIGSVRVVDARYVDLAHRLGLAVHAWTVNDRAQMIQLLDLGVDGIISDRVDVLRDVLQSRGQWRAPPSDAQRRRRANPAAL